MPYLKKQALCPEPIDCKILTAALNLFVENGYHRVSIHDIQKQSNVSIGSIYNHFGGKEGIAKALYEHIINELNELIDDVIQSTSSPLKQCNKILKQLFQYTETHRDIIAFLFHTKHAEFITKSSSIYDSLPFKKLNILIKQGIQQGAFKDINPNIISAGIFGGSIHMIQLRLDGIIKTPLNDAYKELVNNFL